MVVAGEKHLDIFGWGEAEQFHAVEYNGKRFWLFDVVTITTKDGEITTGEIGYISESSIDILPEHRYAETINFVDITSYI